jgi:hypothetical protein
MAKRGGQRPLIPNLGAVSSNLAGDATLNPKALFLLGSTFLPFKYPTIHPTKNNR